MKYVLAIDQGTTGTTAILVDRSGQVVARAYAELPQHYPQPGWVEHDPDVIWHTVERTVSQLLADGLDPRDLSAIGITNQRETALAWNRETGVPLGRAIVWQCRRTTSLCERWRSHEAAIRQKTGLVLDPYFSATKWVWMREHWEKVDRALQQGDAALGTVDSWLLWKLSGHRIHATDHTNASRTLLFNIHTLDWDADLLQLFQLPRQALPAVFPSSFPYGETRDLKFLPDGIPLAGVAGDQQAALFGQRCVRPGLVKNTYGTGCFLMMYMGTEAVVSERGLLTTLACTTTEKPEYALEGSVFIAGAVVQWLRDELGVIASASEVETLARQVPDSGGLIFVPAFTGLGAPYWVPEARGAILGLTRGSSKAHLARAALEAIAHQSADVIEAMRSDGAGALEELRVDGGASANDLLMQIQADLIGCPVNRPRVVETTALGAAFLAGLQIELWSSEQLETCRQVDSLFYPQIDAQERLRQRAAWKAAVQRVI